MAKGDEAAIAGRLDEAQRLFAGICRSDPADAEAWVKLAMVEKRRGQLDEAERCARRGVALAPRIGFAHHALGVVLHAQGRPDEAAAAYRRAIELQPGLADAHYLLGCVLRGQGRLDEAAASLRRALALQPALAEALAELGALQLLAGDVAEGAALLRRAALLNPANVEIQCNLAQALRASADNAGAIATYRQALALQPDAVEALAGLASLLEQGGELDEARDQLERARAQAPQHPAVLLSAARLARRDRRHEDAARDLQALLAQPGLPLELQGEAELLLGLVLDQLQQPEAAWALFVSGKDKRRRLAGLDGRNNPALYRARVERLRALCDERLAACAPLAADEGQADPVFLVGFPRSGTTLLEQILDAHPGLRAMEEHGAVDRMVDAFQADAGPDPAAALAALDDGRARALRAQYWQAVAQRVALQPGERLLDKLPLNIAAVPVIWRLFPRARFIVALRHPADVVLSCLMQDFAANLAMSSFYSLEDAAALYEQVMAGWLHFRRTLPLAAHDLRYESLIADVPGEAARLLDFLGLPWDDAVLEHTAHARRRAINTPSYQQVVQPVYQSARGRWQRYAGPMAAVLPRLQPFIDAFGYGEGPGH